jgi:histidyl-tRNA synthetase
VTIVGDDEKANGTVGVKDMRSGEQQMVARADVTNFIKSRVRVS